MAPKFLRALRNALFRRKGVSTLPSSDTIASFYAGPAHLRCPDAQHAIDHTANVPTVMVTSWSQSEAMSEIAYAAEPEASFEDDVTWEEGLVSSEYTSDAYSDAESAPSSATSLSDDALEDVCARTNSPDICQPLVNACIDTEPLATYLPVKVASAIPKRLLELLEAERDTEWSAPEVELKEVDDIYAEPNYHVDWLTDDALEEAESRSRKIKRTARMRNLDLEKVVPLKAHEHPEPQSLCKPSVLGGRGRSSCLKTSWNVEALENEARQQAILEQLLEEEAEDVVEDLKDLKTFFRRRI